LRQLALTCALALACAQPLAAQRKADMGNQDRYDDVFRKYSKRFFGVGFDWHYFKAQGLAESGLDPAAKSPVGARGVMQLMPGTYAIIKNARSEQFGGIEDPEWNIAAGILYNRDLWQIWGDTPDEDERLRFMFGSYNAGPGTIKRATRVAKTRQLDDHTWRSVEEVAPSVQRWRYKETLPYVRKIEDNHRTLAGSQRGKLVKKDVNARDPKRGGPAAGKP
jgi:membrane-bound lytic murein transglycosylase MltF